MTINMIYMISYITFINDNTYIIQNALYKQKTQKQEPKDSIF